jgi:peptidyl-prolyl cis-trans isomerase SurA
MGRLVRHALIIAGLVLCAPAAVTAQNTLRAAAVVNDQIISIFDVNQRLLLTIVSSGLKDTPELRQRLVSQVLRNLIDERLQAQEAARLGITVTDKQVEQATEQIAKQNKMAPEQFYKLLDNRGITREAMFDRVRAQLLWQALVARRLRPNAQVTEDEVDAVVRRIEANQGKVIWRISEIFLATDTPDQADDVRANAQRIVEELRNKADFAALAKQFSDSASAQRGGDVGWVQQGQLPEDVESVLATMKPGQIAGPVRTLTGFYILLLRDEKQVAAGDVTLDLKQILFALPADASAEQRAAVTARATEAQGRINGCDGIDALARSVGSPGSGDLGQVKLSDLPGPVREAVAGLGNGEASKPLPVGGGLSVLVVCNRQDEGIDRARIKARLLDERINLQARRFMRDLRRDANVDVRI